MTVKKLIGTLHLWLGLASGLVVFIIAVTGCIYAFQMEIKDLTQPYRFVERQEQAVLLPSQLQAIAEKELPGKHVHAVQYTQGEAAQVIFFHFDPWHYYIAYLNPYSGEVLKVKDVDWDFFRIVLMGHFYLWLPEAIGQPLIASATLIFVVMLISGLILWWPRNQNGTRQRFTIKWNARWRRRNYDLHSVLGFYVTGIALILALTGLVWGFEWFASGVFKIAGGKELLPYQDPPSDTTATAALAGMPALDQVYHLMRREYPTAEAIEVHPPESPQSSIAANANPDARTYYQIDYRYFDQYTLLELPVEHYWGRVETASAADKLMRMNYDIHTGAILGLPGKILAFCASLLCASLPITGFLVWWGRRKKNKEGPASVAATRGKARAKAVS